MCVKDDRVDYDRLCLMNLRTERGLIGRCVQDVVTQPARKWARLQYANGFVEWQCGREPGVDVVASTPDAGAVEQKGHEDTARRLHRGAASTSRRPGGANRRNRRSRWRAASTRCWSSPPRTCRIRPAAACPSTTPGYTPEALSADLKG